MSVNNNFTEATTMQPENPTLSGRYRVIRQMGQGGMGSVYLAEDTKLDNRRVAIKMLPSILIGNKRAYAHVKAEALVSLKLSHPNIATFRGFEEHNGSPYLVMDYIDGQSLDDYLAEKGKLSEAEMVKLLSPIAAAIDYAHTEGVVHRDIKPANVMIRKDGHPFILDFGIAREIQETMTRVTGQNSSGTLMYMSPEQLMGAAPTPAQDVYSFAATCYECLCGHPPFWRGSIEEQIKTGEPDPSPEGVAIISSVLAGLAKDPTVRPKSCRDVLTLATAPLSEPERNSGASISSCHLRNGLAAYENKDWDQAFHEFSRTDLTDARVQFNLGIMYYKGQGVPQDYADAVKWFRKAADQGYARAQYNLGVAYANGQGVTQDYDEAVKWYRKAADQGDADVQFYLGAMYVTGKGVTKDYAEAEKWFRKAANQDVAEAQYWLGLMYEKGQGVTQDYAEAVKWYRKSADQGDADAQYNLGVAYANGQGVTQDYAEAVRWCRKAADQGNAGAQYNLGVAYAKGQGVTQDYAEAVKWYCKAAAQGNADAQCDLGYMYERGYGVVQDYAEAARWFRKAADQGDAGAQFFLGLLYEEGRGVKANRSMAIDWLRKAAKQNYQGAVKELRKLGVQP